MTSLGKQPVHCISYMDGAEFMQIAADRTVYQKKDGTYWVNDLNAKRRVERGADGVFIWKFFVISGKNVNN